MSDAYVDDRIGRRRREALTKTDALPKEIKQVVHDFGLPIVDVLWKHGIKRAVVMREIINTIMLGPRQEGQRNGVMSSLDVILAQGPINSSALTRLLNENSMTICTVEPTRKMLDASLSEVSGFNMRVTKEEKHRLRLRAALRASMQNNR